MNRIKKKWHKNMFLVVAFLMGSITASSVRTFAEEGTPEWSYGGAANPTRWGELSDDFAKCESGTDQSPINIPTLGVIPGSLARITFDYKPTPLTVVNNGHTIQVNYGTGSTVTINGKTYELVQFHFHTPSEHTIKGNAEAMELHLVHRNTAGQLSVVGILVKEGAANPVIDQIWPHIPASGQTNTVSNQTINAADFLPPTKTYYSYSGSLTTPPCSEGVKWNVLKEPITFSQEQIRIFEKYYQVNARPVQPLNGRIIEYHP